MPDTPIESLQPLIDRMAAAMEASAKATTEAWDARNAQSKADRELLDAKNALRGAINQIMAEKLGIASDQVPMDGLV